MPEGEDQVTGASPSVTDDTLAANATEAEARDPSAASDDAAPAEGALIGRYVVLSKLGAGAMGLVLAAYDPQLDRKVALKLLARRGAKTPAAQARLAREAQALAKLGHPNVVAVHDVGQHGDQVFVAMEFVDGQTLGEWLGAAPGSHPWREVVRVFTAAGRGLAAAHAAGLVHRDFKPDNVMIGRDARVRVMDFGLARVEAEPEPEPEADPDPGLESDALTKTDASPSTRLTRTGVMLGTPAYMALEQFQRRTVDARSDQFGFCVALYEALYGERPFAGRTVFALVAALQHAQPRDPPSGTSVPAWLRKVVVRGLARDPDQRFQSMEALLDALADDPALRRRRWVARFGLAAALAGTAGLTVWATRSGADTCADMDVHLAGVWDDARRTEVHAALEAGSSTNGAATAERVARRLDDYTDAWLAARTTACEASQRGEQSGTLLDLRMACLDRSLAHVRATVDVLAAADAVVIDNAVLAVANLPSLERCADVEALTSAQPPPTDPELAARVAALDQRLIEIAALERTGKYREALPLADQVLLEAKPLGYAPLLARASLNLGQIRVQTSDYREAEASLVQAYELALSSGMLDEAARASSGLVSLVGARLARFDEGRRWALDAGALATATDSDSARALVLRSRASIAGSEGKYDEARELGEQAVDIYEQALGSADPDFPNAIDELGNYLGSLGEYERARQLHERALGLIIEQLGESHPNVLAPLVNLGNAEVSMGRNQDALAHYERALALAESALGPDHTKVATILANLAGVLEKLGRYELAEAQLQRALETWTAQLGPEHPNVAVGLSVLGSLAMAQGDTERARGYHQGVLELFENTLGLDHPDVGYTLFALADIALQDDDPEAAIELYTQTLAVWEPALGPEHPRVAQALVGLGQAMTRAHRDAEAVELLERALAILSVSEQEADPEHLAAARFYLAVALWDAPAGDRVRARKLATLARTSYSTLPNAREQLAEVDTWLDAHAEQAERD